MLVLNQDFWGLIVFCFVQLAYTLRYGGFHVLRQTLPGLAALFAVLSVMLKLPLLVAIAGVYAANFMLNLGLAARIVIKNLLPKSNAWFSLLGMALFACCDVNVMLLNTALPFATAHFAAIDRLIWVFYLPGQLLLALSGRDYSA